MNNRGTEVFFAICRLVVVVALSALFLVWNLDTEGEVIGPWFDDLDKIAMIILAWAAATLTQRLVQSIFTMLTVRAVHEHNFTNPENEEPGLCSGNIADARKIFTTTFGVSLLMGAVFIFWASLSPLFFAIPINYRGDPQVPLSKNVTTTSQLYFTESEKAGLSTTAAFELGALSRGYFKLSYVFSNTEDSFVDMMNNRIIVPAKLKSSCYHTDYKVRRNAQDVNITVTALDVDLLVANYWCRENDAILNKTSNACQGGGFIGGIASAGDFPLKQRAFKNTTTGRINLEVCFGKNRLNSVSSDTRTGLICGVEHQLMVGTVVWEQKDGNCKIVSVDVQPQDPREYVVNRLMDPPRNGEDNRTGQLMNGVEVPVQNAYRTFAKRAEKLDFRAMEEDYYGALYAAATAIRSIKPNEYVSRTDATPIKDASGKRITIEVSFKHKGYASKTLLIILLAYIILSAVSVIMITWEVYSGRLEAFWHEQLMGTQATVVKKTPVIRTSVFDLGTDADGLPIQHTAPSGAYQPSYQSSGTTTGSSRQYRLG